MREDHLENAATAIHLVDFLEDRYKQMPLLGTWGTLGNLGTDHVSRLFVLFRTTRVWAVKSSDEAGTREISIPSEGNVSSAFAACHTSASRLIHSADSLCCTIRRSIRRSLSIRRLVLRWDSSFSKLYPIRRNASTRRGRSDSTLP